jgi:DNA repair protein RecN (Recombination protein N)
MLEELRIQNFAIIDNLTLEFSKGFNVITGETGAGKSILVDAVELLLGSRSDNSFVRSGADKAVVEGVFALSEQAQALVVPILMEAELIHDESEARYLTLSRELRHNGRSSSRLNGVTCSAEILREIGEALVDIHGQSAHISLFKPRAHMNLLDRYADLLEVRSALTKVVDTLHDIRREIRSLRDDKEALERRADRLRYEVEDVDSAKLKEDEEEALMIELGRLGNSEKLSEMAGAAVVFLSGDESTDEIVPAVDALMQVSQLLEKLLKLDPSIKDDYDLAQDISTNAQELAINLSGYFDGIEHDPQRLADVEERMEVIKKLKRRYNAETIGDLLNYADRARAELEGIEHSEERLDALVLQEEKTLRHIGELCERIAKVREVAGRALSKKVMRELADLRMEQTTFEVMLERTEDPNGAYGKDGKRYRFDATGMENVEFMMSANVGEPLRPLAKVASGGEASRIMLALKRVLTQADYTPTLIFDEVDQGIGGRIGGIVGEKLWSLTEGHQVLCVTHLPQLASYGDKHFHVSKHVKGQRTASEVRLLADETVRVNELAAMIGGTGESVIQSARDILDEAEHRKVELRQPTQPQVQKKML